MLSDDDCYWTLRRRSFAAVAARPEPSNSRLAGSGTVGGGILFQPAMPEYFPPVAAEDSQTFDFNA